MAKYLVRYSVEYSAFIEADNEVEATTIADTLHLDEWESNHSLYEVDECEVDNV